MADINYPDWLQPDEQQPEEPPFNPTADDIPPEDDAWSHVSGPLEDEPDQSKEGQPQTATQPEQQQKQNEVPEGITVHQAVYVTQQNTQNTIHEINEEWPAIDLYEASTALRFNVANMGFIDLCSEQKHQWDNFITNFSESAPVAKEYVVAVMFGMVAMATFGKAFVPFNGAAMPVNLFSVYGGFSSSQKNTPLKKLQKCLDDFITEQNSKRNQTNKVLATKIAVQERKKLKIKESSDPAITQIENQISAYESMKRVLLPEKTTETTPEGIARRMKICGGCGRIASGEPNILNVVMGKTYSKTGTVNVDIFMNGYDGDGVSILRSNEDGCISINRTSINILVAAQPHKMREFLNCEQLIDRGFIQRFLIYPVPPENNDSFDAHRLPKLDDESLAYWSKHITRIAERFSKTNNPVPIKLDKDADYALRDLWNQTRRFQQKYSKDSFIGGWFGKAHGLAARLSAVIALLRDPMTETIIKEDVAIVHSYIFDYFAQAIINPDNAEIESIPDAEYAIYRYCKRYSDSHTMDNEPAGKILIERDKLYRSLKQKDIFKGKEGIETFNHALKQLEERSIIRRVTDGIERRKPKQIWQFNPKAAEGITKNA